MNKIPAKNQLHQVESKSDFGLLKPAHCEISLNAVSETMQIAELMAMSNSVLPPMTERMVAHADLRPYYLKDMERGKQAETGQNPVPPSSKTAAAKNKKHK